MCVEVLLYKQHSESVYMSHYVSMRIKEPWSERSLKYAIASFCQRVESGHETTWNLKATIMASVNTLYMHQDRLRESLLRWRNNCYYINKYTRFLKQKWHKYDNMNSLPAHCSAVSYCSWWNSAHCLLCCCYSHHSALLWEHSSPVPGPVGLRAWWRHQWTQNTVCIFKKLFGYSMGAVDNNCICVGWH